MRTALAFVVITAVLTALLAAPLAYADLVPTHLAPKRDASLREGWMGELSDAQLARLPGPRKGPRFTHGTITTAGMWETFAGKGDTPLPRKLEIDWTKEGVAFVLSKDFGYYVIDSFSPDPKNPETLRLLFRFNAIPQKSEKGKSTVMFVRVDRKKASNLELVELVTQGEISLR